MHSNDIVSHAFQGVQVRNILRGGEPWFIVADVLAVLELDRTALRRLDDDEKGVDSIHTLGGEQDMVTVNEAGLYSLILGSRKPEAKAFKRWVTHEVLPSIRRTGTYTAAPALPQSYAEALRELAATVEQNAALEAKVEHDAPKVAYVDGFVRPDDVILFRNVAKALGWAESDLRVELMERGWIYAETDRRWSQSKQDYETRTRYSAYADKARYFHPVPAHDAPRFKGSEVMHTLKVTPAGAEAIARNFGKAAA